MPLDALVMHIACLTQLWTLLPEYVFLSSPKSTIFMVGNFKEYLFALISMPNSICQWGQYLAKKLNFWVHSQKNPFTNWKTKRALYMKYQKRGICGKMVFKESGLFSFQGNICRAGHESPHWEGVLMKVQVLVGAVAQGEGFADFEVYEVCGPV